MHARDIERYASAGLISLLGLVFLALNARRLLTLEGPGVALLLGGLGAVLALVLVGAGFALVVRGFSPAHTMRVAGWAVLGTVVLGLVLGLIVLSGATLEIYQAATLLSVSTFAHVLIGVRDVQRIRAKELARQREQLAVLNRLVRHNLGQLAQRLLFVESDLPRAAEEETRTALAETVETIATDLSEMRDRLEQSQQLFGEDTDDFADVALGPMVDEIVAEYRDRYPDATVAVDVPTDCRVVGGEYLRQALTELVENGLEHADEAPEVSIEAVVTGRQVTIEVRDNGPGVPEQERAVITRAADITQLNHSQGLGLWFVRWVTDALGGDFDLTSTPDGTTVRLQVPQGQSG